MARSLNSLSLNERPNFVSTPDDKYECAKCKLTLLPPIKQTQCGHRMCSSCIDDLFGDNEQAICPGDDECEPLLKSQVFN